MNKRGRLRPLAAMAMAVFALLWPVPALAVSANISHSYSADGSLSNGDIVSLDPNRSNYVQPANVTNASRLIGVIVQANDSLLAVNSGNSQVQVATDGLTNTLASTVNGDINVGDQVAVSPFNGIGMKAAPGSRIIGLAQTSLNNSTAGSSLESVKDSSGKSQQIRVGYLRLTIVIGITDATSPEKLNSLQRLVQRLTGREVPTLRIVLSLGVALIALAVLVTLIYSTIYSTIVGISRNPLARHQILQGLGAVIFMSTMLAVVAMVIVYFLLH